MIVPRGSIARKKSGGGTAYRVPRDAHANDVGSVYPPAGVVDRVPPSIRESTYLHTFWFKPVSSFGLFDMTMFIDSSSGLALSFLPLPLSACYWQTQRSITGSPTVLLRVRFRQLHTEGLLPLHVPVGAVDGTTGSKNSSTMRLSRRTKGLSLLVRGLLCETATLSFCRRAISVSPFIG